MSGGSRPNAGEPIGRRWWALAVIDLCLLLTTLDNTILNVALPTISRQLGATGAQLQWMVDAYIVVFAGLLLMSGTLGDRLGRRRLLVLGLSVIGVASLATTLVGNADQLIAIRALMGLGGALLMPSTLSLVTNLFSEAERPRAIATWSAVAGLGMVLGPMVGGALLENFSWTSIFLFNVPIALAGIVGSLWLIPESRDPHPDKLDPIGAILSIAGMATLVYGLIEAPAAGWGSAATIVRIGAGLAVLAAFVIWELHSSSPMVDMRLFAKPAFGAASLAETVAHFALVGAMFGLTLYLQFVWGQRPFMAGVAMLPIAIGVIAGSLIASRLMPRIGPRFLVTGGMVGISVGLFLISRLAVDTPYPVFAAMLLALSTGMGLAMMPATESIMGAVDKARAGVGSATNDTTRELGSALGVAVLGSLISSSYRDAVTARLADLPGGIAGLPDSIGAAVRDSIGSATVAAGQIQGETGARILEASRGAFVSGLDTAAVVGAVVVALGAAVVVHWLPGRTGAEESPARAPRFGHSARLADRLDGTAD
jgi:EmrB/QacA subfamily drug resistance transporter